METLQLVIPTKAYENQVMNYKEEFLKNNDSFDGCAGLDKVESYDEWLNFEERLSNLYKENYVPSNVYLAIRKEDNKLVGIIDLRLSLSDFLLKFGGNIGYSVLPQERKKGYAKQMLKLILDNCKKLGMKKVLLTCDKENIASSKTILANGGILENEVNDEYALSKSGTIQRYWINVG